MAIPPAKKKKRRKSAAVPAFAPQRLTEREKIIAGGVFFVAAFVIRLAYILLSRDQPTFEALAMDPLYHHDVAVTIANGDWLAGDEPLYRSPFYMYVLALVYKIFGVGYMVPRVFGAFTGSVSVVLILLIGDKLFGRRAALIAGVFALLFWPLIYFDGELLTTSFTVMMGLVLIVLFIRAYESPTVRRLVILGLFFGLMAITRENYLPIIGLAFLFWVVLLRRLLSPTLFLVSAVAVVSLITLRNYVVLNDFVPITHYTGVNFYIGNNPFSDGRTAVLPCVRASWWGGVEDTKAVAEAHTQSSLKPSGINAFWFGETLNYIGSNFASCTRETALLTPTVDGKRSCGFKPGSQCVSFLEGATRKALYVVDPFEFSNNKELYFIRDLSPVIGFPLLWLFANLTAIPLGFIGMYFAWRDRQRKALPLAVILVGYAIGLSLGFVNTRIRMPMTVLWIIFSGHAIASLWTRRRPWRIWVPAAVAIFFVTLLLNPRPDGHWERSTLAGHFTLANAYMQQGELEKAEEHYLKSARLTVGEYGQRSMFGLTKIAQQQAEAAMEAEDYGSAEAHWRKMLSYHDHFQAWLGLAAVALATEDPEVEKYYQEAVRSLPPYPQPYLEMAKFNVLRGDLAEARNWLERAKLSAPDETLRVEIEAVEATLERSDSLSLPQ